MILFKFLSSFLVALQVIGPSWVLAIQTSEAVIQKPSMGEAIISGIRGVVTVSPGEKDLPGYSPAYRSILTVGDVISTEEESVAEILLENQGLVSVQEYSEVLLSKNAYGELAIILQVGSAEWSIPMHGQDGASLAFRTPNIRAMTSGGLITAEVQQTLRNVAQHSQAYRKSLIRTNLRSESVTARDVGLVETFCVNEGKLTVEFPGTQQGTWKQKTIAPGECLGFLNGQIRTLEAPLHLSDWRAVCAVGAHCEIPEPTKKLIAKKQMSQALALQHALVGAGSEDVEVNEQVVLATTGASNGLLLAANTQGSEPGIGNIGGVILPTTGGDPSLGGDSSGSTPPLDPPLPLPREFPEVNVGGTVPPSTSFFSAENVGGGSPPFSGFDTNVQSGTSLWPVNGTSGGQGVLNFVNGDFTADKELLLADSGLLASAPHLGKVPQNSLVVSDLRPAGSISPSNQKIPLNFALFNIPASRLPVAIPDPNPSPTSNPQLGVEGSSRLSQSEQLAQFARSSLIDPDDILAAVPDTSAEFPCQLSAISCFELILAAGLGGLEQPDPKVDSDAGIDGTVQVRSASTGVTLKKGVVLTSDTQVALALQEKTNESFSGLETTLGQAVQASAVSILGEPGDPAIVKMEDRTLAILEGSRIQPANSMFSTALLSILDGTLLGPVELSVIGKDANGIDLLRDEVSPIIEIIDGSAEVTTGVMVGSTANSGQTGDLDQALLEASSPLLAMLGGTLETASDFGRVAGQNAKLNGTLLPGDALVRLNASSMMVNGNLFNVTGGGQLNVINGSLVSLQDGSTLTLAGGAFVNVGTGSLFSLTNGALVDFGTGNNVVNLSNSLCAGGGCFSPFSNPNWQVAGNQGDFSAPAGFNPFVDLGTFNDGSMNTVNISPDSAILSVQPGGSIQIQ